MTRGFAVVLTLLLLGFALYAGWYATRRTEYFPPALQTTSETCEYGPGMGETKSVMHEVEAEILAEELAAFHEPSLLRRIEPAVEQSIRFLLLTDYDSPIVVRVDKLANGQRRMTAKTRPGGTGFGPGVRRKADIVRTLSVAEIATLEQLISKSGIQQAPSNGCSAGWPGWVVEFADPATGYRYRTRTPYQPSPINSLAIFLAGLPGWGLPSDLIPAPPRSVPPASP